MRIAGTKKHIMKNSNLCWAVFMAMIAVMMVACGGGVNHSDPKSVADAVLECYDKGDYETMKTLINPEDVNGLNEMDEMIEMSRKYVEEHGKGTNEPKERTFKSVTDRFTDGEITSESTDAVVSYDGEWPRKVMLIRADGKWYFDRLK